MVSPQQNTQFFDALFCEEDHFDTSLNSSLHKEDVDDDENEEEEADSCSSHHSLTAHSFISLFEQDEELRRLLHKEEGEEPHRNLEKIPSLDKGRKEVVQWMLRVIAYFSFSSLTAVLAVTYLDRFLHRFQPFTDKKPWMFQLAAVACLSLAAKLDETDVPLLLDLQVEEPRFVFEPKNIQKMEILVLSTLEWKMNSVTPISFLDHIARKLSLKDHLSVEFLTRCERLILSVITDSRFMAYLPSKMATATMVHVVTNIDPSIALEHHDQLLGILGTNKDRVRDCLTLIDEVATNVGIDSKKKRKLGSLPCSPKGLFDLSFISDSSNDSWEVSSSPPQPKAKKIKMHENFQFSEF